MLGGNEYTGIALEDDILRIAHLKESGGVLKLVKLDKYSLIEELDKAQRSASVFGEVESSEEDYEDAESESIFGLDEDEETELEETELEDEIKFDDLESEEEQDVMSLDMVDEAETAQSNEILLYNILSELGGQKSRIGLNIPAGNSIFQIIKDTDFSEYKTRDLVEDIEEKLESIYGMPKSPDNYSYEIEDDGSLLLVSIDDEPALLKLVNRVRELHSGKLIIEEIFPDEIILTGLVRANYVLPKDQITGILQFGPRRSRIVFLRGDKIWLVSPIINEGTRNRNILNTVFSKILFQLDTGEVPNLDRLIIANNSLGDDAVNFFQKNFPDMTVEEFRFNERKIDFEGIDYETTRPFTTAIGMAWAAAGFEEEQFPSISLIPEYIKERQKIFKLQWHGVLLLLLIFLAPLTINYFYQQNQQQIDNMETELQRINTQITEITPTVNNTNQLKQDLSLLREKLVLLDTLSRGSREWSTKVDIVNEGFSNVGNSWLLSLAFTQDGYIIDGYTLYRYKVPQLVNIFDDATLLNVTIDEIREQEIYRFTILIKEFATDQSRYSPPKPENLQKILGGN